MKDVMIATSEKTDIKGPIRAADPSALPALSRRAYARQRHCYISLDGMLWDMYNR